MNTWKRSWLIAASLALFAWPAHADEVSSSRIQALNDKQDQILKTLEEIKAELQVIKVRVTQ